MKIKEKNYLRRKSYKFKYKINVVNSAIGSILRMSHVPCISTSIKTETSIKNLLREHKNSKVRYLRLSVGTAKILINETQLRQNTLHAFQSDLSLKATENVKYRKNKFNSNCNGNKSWRSYVKI